MTGLNKHLHRLGTVGMLAFAVSLPGFIPASAQDVRDGPRQLFRPAPPATEPPARVTEQPHRPAPQSGIGAVRLSSADPESFGLLSAEQGGFGVEMWRGTPRELVAQLLPLLPEIPTLTVQHSLTRRLLTSTAPAPHSIRDAETADMSLLGLRIEKLARIGALSEAARLAALTGLRHNDPVIPKAQAEAHLLLGETGAACTTVRNQLGRSEDVFWQKLAAYCDAMRGDADKAGVALSLLREQAGAEDAAFELMMDQLLGAPAGEVPEPAALTSLHVALYRATDTPFPEGFLRSERLDHLVAIALSQNAGAEQRFRAGRRAAAAGALTALQLPPLAAGLDVTQEVLADPLAAGLDRDDPLSQAILYRAVQRSPVAFAQAEILAALLDTARESGRYSLAARLVTDLVADLPVTEQLAWFAPHAVRVFALNGDRGRQDQWISLWRAVARTNPELAAVFKTDLPLRLLTQTAAPTEIRGEALGAWVQTALAPIGEEESSRPRPGRDDVGLLITTLAGLGIPVGPEIWLSLLTPPLFGTHAAAPPPVAIRYREAVADNRIGEALLIGLIMLQPDARVSSDTLGLFVDALLRLGLEEDARQLVLTHLLDRGL